MKESLRKSAVSPEIVALGKRIDAIIKSKGMKIREAAHGADLETENLRKYIKGTQEMKITTMLRIAKALEVTVWDLFKAE